MESHSAAHLDLRNSGHAKFQSSQSAQRGCEAARLLRFRFPRCEPATEFGAKDRIAEHFRFDAACDPAAPNGDRVASGAEDYTAERVRTVQRYASRKRCRPGGREPALFADF